MSEQRCHLFEPNTAVDQILCKTMPEHVRRQRGQPSLASDPGQRALDGAAAESLFLVAFYRDPDKIGAILRAGIEPILQGTPGIQVERDVTLSSAFPLPDPDPSFAIGQLQIFQLGEENGPYTRTEVIYIFYRFYGGHG